MPKNRSTSASQLISLPEKILFVIREGFDRTTTASDPDARILDRQRGGDIRNKRPSVTHNLFARGRRGRVFINYRSRTQNSLGRQRLIKYNAVLLPGENGRADNRDKAIVERALMWPI